MSTASSNNRHNRHNRATITDPRTLFYDLLARGVTFQRDGDRVGAIPPDGAKLSDVTTSDERDMIRANKPALIAFINERVNIIRAHPREALRRAVNDRIARNRASRDQRALNVNDQATEE